MGRDRIGRMVEVAGTSVHVREDGPESARPIVLVHGYLGSMHWFDETAAALAATFRVVRLDLLGHGRTDRASSMDGPAQAAMLAGLLDALDLDDVVVVGHSFGNDATVGAAVTSRRVSAVVVVGQGPDQNDVKLPLVGAILRTPVLGSLVHRETRPFLLRDALRPTFAPGFKPTPAVWEQAFLDHQSMHPDGHRAVMVERKHRLSAKGLDAQLAESGLPALAILGRHDCFYDPETARARYAAAGAQVVVLDTGHNVQIERPREVADLIRAFVDQLPQP